MKAPENLSRAPSNSQTWWSTAIDRQRSLAITAPLQSLDAFKSHIGAQKHDIRTYCLHVIDQVVLGMRAHRGERMDVVQKALAELIARCDPQVSEEFKGRIVIYVIDGLLNARGRGEPFSEILTAFDESGTARRERFPFTLLEAKDIGDDDFYLVASPQAIRLYTDLLARDVTDEQVANEYLFRFLVERGEWQKAAEESARMELLSLEYEQTIRKAIEQTEVNVRAVNWKDTVCILQRARSHVGERVKAENSVLASLREKLAQGDALSNDDRSKLVNVEETLNTVICRHTRLAKTLLEANKRFAEAQNTQCYRPRCLSSFADLENDLFRPLLLMTTGHVAANAEDFADFVFRPEPRPLPSLVEMVDRLLQPEKEHHAPTGDADGDLEGIEPEPPFLVAEDFAQAEAMLTSINEPCLLTEVLREMSTQGLKPKVRDLVVTELLKIAGTSESRLHVLRTGRKLAFDGYTGDELTIELIPTGSPSRSSHRQQLHA
jgi:hypothetical protein